MEIFAKNVREAAKELNLNATSLGAKVGLASSTAANYWSGKRPWPSELVPELAKHLRTDANGLFGLPSISAPVVSGDQMRRWLRSGDSPADDVQANEGADLVPIASIDQAYGMGGTFTDMPVEEHAMLFPRQWIESITHSPPSALTWARGRGDSMAPTINDNDLVLFDRSQRVVREQDAIWALTVGDIGMIKRLRVRRSEVQILSDNDRVPTDLAHTDEVNIIGRLVFIGRRI